MSISEVVIDTNVLVAGLRSRNGRSFKLLNLIGKGRFNINLSIPLLLEYEDVLTRQLPHLSITKSDISDLLDYYCAVGRGHQIYYLWRPTLRDPSDEMLLELAVKANCDGIITFNKRDFIGSEQFGVALYTPGEFLAQIGE